MARAYYERKAPLELAPIVVDVHTQATDEAGRQVGRVLYVRTRAPRLMTVTLDTCDGRRTYSGFVSSSHQQVTGGFERLHDEEWRARLPELAEAEWLRDLVDR